MADDDDSSGGVSRQLDSLHRSCLFLRHEHLTLIHGLHLEILSLQKRCSELTSEIKDTPPGRSQIELQEEEELLDARCQEMEERLSEQECTLGELRKELGHKGALVGALRATLKEKERHFLEELKRRSHCSTILNTELQKQTEAAAYLSFQLHAARQKLHQQRMQQRQGQLARGPPGPAAAAAAAAAQHGPPHASPVVKPKRKSARASLRVERGRECVPMEKVTGPAEPTAMPDPALFLQPWRHRARPRHSHRAPPLGLEEEEEGQGQGQGQGQGRGDGGGGEGPVEGASRLVAAAAAATAPPAAQAEAD